MEDDRIGCQELLVARNNKRGRKIHGQIQCISKIQKLKRSTSGKANVQCNPRKTMEPYLGRLHHQTAISPGIQCYLSSIRLLQQNGTFHSNNGENISRRTCKAVLRSCMEAAQTSRKHHIGQESTVCSRNNKGIE